MKIEIDSSPPEAEMKKCQMSSGKISNSKIPNNAKLIDGPCYILLPINITTDAPFTNPGRLK